LFASVDTALKWCEDELLLRGSPKGATPSERSVEADTQARTEASAGSADSSSTITTKLRPYRCDQGAVRCGWWWCGSWVVWCRLPNASRAVGCSGHRHDETTGAAALPFAPSALPNQLAWSRLLPFGSTQPLRPGELLTMQGKVNKELFVTPVGGAALRVTVDVGHGDGPLHLGACPCFASPPLQCCEHLARAVRS
jgi:hypothetical protein